MQWRGFSLSLHCNYSESKKLVRLRWIVTVVLSGTCELGYGPTLGVLGDGAEDLAWVEATLVLNPNSGIHGENCATAASFSEEATH